MPDRTVAIVLGDAEKSALRQLRDELYPEHTLSAVAQKLLRDALVGAGVLKLPRRNRSKGAQRS